MRNLDYPNNLIREILPNLEETRQYPPDILQVIAYILAGLDERERDIVLHRFKSGLSLSEVGKIYGITGSAVGQIEDRVILKLRSFTNVDLLKYGVFGYCQKQAQNAYEIAFNVMLVEVARQIERHNKTLILPEDGENIISITLDKLGLSYRSRHYLKTHGVTNAYDIVRMSGEEFNSIRGLGAKSRREIVAALEEKHFNCDHLKSRKKQIADSEKTKE